MPDAPPRPALPPVRPHWRADIEGLRGVAVLLVVLYHAGTPGFGGGYVGVDVFFALSGYLITGILVRELERTGGIDLARFYARRVRRLLPASAVVLLATVAVAAVFLSPLEQAPLARTALATALYLSNVHFARGATDYLGQSAETDPLLHTWSLAVEEQFYLAWPLLVLVGALGLAALRRRPGAVSRRRLIGLLGAAALASFALTLALQATGRDAWAFFAAPARAWEFALGGLGALVPLAGRSRFAGLTFRGRPLPPTAAAETLGGLGLGAILASGALYGAATPFPGWTALAPIVGTVLVLRAGSAAERSVLARALAWRPLRELGRLSYAWYLWHWPVLVFAAALVPDLGLGARLALCLGALGIAELSYRFVEAPVRGSAWLSGRPRRGLALLLALTALGAGASWAWGQGVEAMQRRPEQARFVAARADVVDLYERGCHDPAEATDPSACLSGPGGAPLVALVGDSHAAQWASALQDAAAARGWRLVTLTKSSCPPVDAPFFNAWLGRDYRECPAWRAAALGRLAELRPDVIVASGDVDYPFSGAEWREGTARTLGRLAEIAPVVWIRDTPAAGFDVPACLSRRAWRETVGLGPALPCEFAGATHPATRRLVDAAVASVDGVRVVDPGAALCDGGPCRAELRGQVAFRDAAHLTATAARALGAPLVRAVEAELARP